MDALEEIKEALEDHASTIEDAIDGLRISMWLMFIAGAIIWVLFK